MKDLVTPLAAAMVAIAAVSFGTAAPWRSAHAGDSAQRSPIVVELFTSQGCSSCPPADVVLGELRERADVLPLSFHVTYWDRLGWPDTFGLEASTERQRSYAATLHNDGLYTPQMVIGGRVDVVGSRRGRVREAIELLASHETSTLPIAVDGGRLRLGSGAHDAATIWLFGIDRAHDVAIERGENRGRQIRYHNVVREVTRLGRWSGDGMELALPLERLRSDGRDSAAIVVQQRATGAILAAAQVDLAR
jgi:hypothetical protein